MFHHLRYKNWSYLYGNKIGRYFKDSPYYFPSYDPLFTSQILYTTSYFLYFNERMTLKVKLVRLMVVEQIIRVSLLEQVTGYMVQIYVSMERLTDSMKCNLILP